MSMKYLKQVTLDSKTKPKKDNPFCKSYISLKISFVFGVT